MLLVIGFLWYIMPALRLRRKEKMLDEKRNERKCKWIEKQMVEKEMDGKANECKRYWLEKAHECKRKWVEKEMDGKS